MSKEQTRWGERLTAAEEKVEYEEELCDFKDEIDKNPQRQQQQQDTAHSLRIVLVSGNVQENTDPPGIKEEPEEQSIIHEEEQLPILEDNTGRKRKRKFDPEELKVLVDGVKAHYHELKNQHVPIARRNAIWKEITHRVNAVGHKDRTPSEIKRRWQDARRRTKEKVTTNSASGAETGGGPSDHVPLDTIEEQVLLTLCEEQVSGIPAIDTLVSDQDLSDDPQLNSSTAASTSSSHPPPAAAPTPPRPKPRGGDSRARAAVDSDHALLSEIKAQNTSIQDGLSVLTQDIRCISKVARALRGDTRAISRHTRQLVSAVTGLTAAVQELTKAVSERRPPQHELQNGESTVRAPEKPALRKDRK